MKKENAISILVKNFLDYFSKENKDYDKIKEACDVAIEALSRDTSYEVKDLDEIVSDETRYEECELQDVKSIYPISMEDCTDSKLKES